MNSTFTRKWAATIDHDRDSDTSSNPRHFRQLKPMRSSPKAERWLLPISDEFTRCNSAKISIKPESLGSCISFSHHLSGYARRWLAPEEELAVIFHPSPPFQSWRLTLKLPFDVFTSQARFSASRMGSTVCRRDTPFMGGRRVPVGVKLFCLVSWAKKRACGTALTEWFTLSQNGYGAYWTHHKWHISLTGIPYKKIGKKSLRHPRVFPNGPPVQYWPGPATVNFGVRKRSGVFVAVWPLARVNARNALRSDSFHFYLAKKRLQKKRLTPQRFDNAKIFISSAPTK